MIDFTKLLTKEETLKALAAYTIPLKNNEKFPNGRVAKGWQKKVWADYSDNEKKDITGRGINCGLAGIVVIDLDIDKETNEAIGWKNWELTCKTLGLDPHETFTVRSPSGGYHLYYAYDHTQDTENPIGQSSRLGKKLNGKPVGIDIRGKNGLIVGPGSNTEKGKYKVVLDLPVAPLPKVLQAILKGTVKAPLVIKAEEDAKMERQSKNKEFVKAEVSRLSGADASTDPDGLKKWQLIKLDQKKNALASSLEGQRDINLTSYSYWAGGEGVPVERVVAELLPVAESVFTKEGDATSEELEDKIRRCAENGYTQAYDPNFTPEWAIEFEQKMETQAKNEAEKKDVKELTKTFTLAKDFMKFLKGTYKYVSEQGEWITFARKTGTWRVDVSDDPHAPAVNIKTILDDWLDARETALKDEYSSVPTLTEPHRRNAVLELLAPRLNYQASIFDKQTNAFNADGTVLDMSAEKYRDTARNARPEDYFTKSSRVPFDPNTDTTVFDNFISMFEKEQQDYLQLIVGQAMTGYQPSDPQVFFFVGDGANGKSTFQMIISRVLGDYMVVPNTDLLLNKKTQEHQKMILMGARCAYFEELPSRDYLDVKNIKDFVGTGKITASRKYENEITFNPFATYFINTNHLPRVRETEDGTWRRLVVIDFPYTFKKNPNPAIPTERKADPQLSLNALQRMPDDHPLFKAALLWMLDGANKWFMNDMETPEMPESYAIASQRWQNANDRIGDWWEETLEYGTENDYVLVKDLYESYRQLAKANGQEPGNKELFMDDLSRHTNMTEKSLVVEKGRVAKLNQSVWFDPEKSWKDEYRPNTPSKDSRPEHIRGVRFLGTSAPDFIDEDFGIDDSSFEDDEPQSVASENPSNTDRNTDDLQTDDDDLLDLDVF